MRRHRSRKITVPAVAMVSGICVALFALATIILGRIAPDIFCRGWATGEPLPPGEIRIYTLISAAIAIAGAVTAAAARPVWQREKGKLHWTYCVMDNMYTYLLRRQSRKESAEDMEFLLALMDRYASADLASDMIGYVVERRELSDETGRYLIARLISECRNTEMLSVEGQLRLMRLREMVS